MPIQTVFCPDCGLTITTDVPIGQRAQLQHRQDGPDLLMVRPNVMRVLTMDDLRANIDKNTNLLNRSDRNALSRD